MIQLIQRAQAFRQRPAISTGEMEISYAQLLQRSERLARALLGGNPDLNEARIAFLVAPGIDYVTLQWGIWRAGGIAVPLCVKHPLPSLRHVIEDAGALFVVYGPEFEETLQPLFGLEDTVFVAVGDLEQGSGQSLPEVAPDRRAMILYTSGTTGKPKGVVTTHANIEASIRSLVDAWRWSEDDRILNILPLHHVHGIVNVLCCALWSGACCEFLPQFSPEAVFARFATGRINLFMAVPTIYYKLIAHYRELPADQQQRISRALRDFRLMVSGSAALPVSVLETWREISDHTLLERYGMTEMGMAISNPYSGERRPGYIGQPLRGVEVRLVDEDDAPVAEGQPGEIQVKGDNVFREYWNRPEATAAAFTPDGWFRTGDIAVWEDGAYRILGRNSVDIIKSGGYKISALEIEEVLRKHPAVRECAVVGLPDEEWGEVIGASLIVAGPEPDLQSLTEWLRERLPGYKLPRRYIFQDDLPRNVMGKVTKQELKQYFA
ncbi:malonyl-CoA/methylmalonyl-CoA synthetase [Lewinella marina]|uniref:Long-chain fatty acid--CoA ligase n=1 Tax=Neolewinella marina TaxID=438751 RepID=A0A2G0CD77_9BACT|nr:acyl-CoA synthetase [Neolewinella marina]NJB86872.1 malonyl-CoA/methylmalonyl-CoA synthetase [Neolewinella marina]PHK97929.1 long-chain fatty acid--CoA ligase [Neolewinella marina]